jgi:hypothetical protein
MNTRTLLLLTLSIGASSSVLAANNTPPEIKRYLKKQGPVIEHRLFRSKAHNQIVVNFCVDENQKGGKNEGAVNPANYHCNAALFNKKGKLVFANQFHLGYGGVKAFANNKVQAESITYSPQDALCCPSIKKKVVFATKSGKLVEILRP